MFDDFLKRRIPGKNGEGTPRTERPCKRHPLLDTNGMCLSCVPHLFQESMFFCVGSGSQSTEFDLLGNLYQDTGLSKKITLDNILSIAPLIKWGKG